MKSRERTLLNAVFSSVGIYTEYFLGMLAAILMARHLGPADYGRSLRESYAAEKRAAERLGLRPS